MYVYILNSRTLCLVCHWVNGWGYRRELPTGHTPSENDKVLPGMVKSRFPHHIATCCGLLGDVEQTLRRWALQDALQHTYLQQDMVHLPQKFLFTFKHLNWPFGHLDQMQDVGCLQKRRPPGVSCATGSLGGELRRVDADFRGLEAQGEARGPCSQTSELSGLWVSHLTRRNGKDHLRHFRGAPPAVLPHRWEWSSKSSQLAGTVSSFWQ